MKDPDLDVLVLGGGISGLACAEALRRRRPGIRLRLLEAAPRLGGVLGTERVGGYLFERGPNGFLDGAPETWALIDALGLRERLIEAAPEARRRYILVRGRLEPLPSGPRDLVRSRILTWGGKARLLLEPFQRRAPAEREDTVASFGRRRLGEAATLAFLDPLVTGIYAGDIERISLEAAFPRLAALEREHGSLFRALRAGAARPPGRLHSFRDGLEELASALGRRLGGAASPGCEVESLESRGDRHTALLRGGGSVAARVAVLALPAPRAAAVVSSSNGDLASALEEIPYAPVAVVCLGYDRASIGHPLDGFGFLVPRGERLRTLGAIWVSTIFPDHAPSGKASLRILVGGARDPEVVGLSAEELERLVLREIGPVLGIRGEPEARKVYRYVQGIPQYNLGHARRLKRLDGWLRRSPGIILAGNAYRGVGMNDCIRDAGRVADEAIACLDRPAPGGGSPAAPARGAEP